MKPIATVTSNKDDVENVWKNIDVDGNLHMICVIEENNIQTILLTDLVHIRLDKLTQQSILQKCEQLNPLLDVDIFDCNEIVKNIFKNIPEYIFKASVDQIQLRANVEGGIFKFALNFSMGTAQEFWKYIMKPLCISSMELMNRHNILIELIKQKDVEIAEYKAEGAELIRKYIETKTFSEDQFKTHFFNGNNIDHFNTFQNVIKFYNKMGFCPTVQVECSASSQALSSEGTSTQILEKDTNPSNSTNNLKIKLEDNSTLQNNESLLGKGNDKNDKVKDTSKRRTLASEIIIAPIKVPNSTKRQRKSLNNIIL